MVDTALSKGKAAIDKADQNTVDPNKATEAEAALEAISSRSKSCSDLLKSIYTLLINGLTNIRVHREVKLPQDFILIHFKCRNTLQADIATCSPEQKSQLR